MNYLVRQADPAKDENHVLSIWKANLPEADSARYRPLYMANPYGSSWVWLACAESETEFIGTTGLCQRRFILNGEKTSAGVAIDFAIHKEHRGFGPALKLQRAVTSSCKDKGLSFIYGFPNKNAESIFQRVRYKVVGKMTRWVKLLRSEYKLKEVINSDLISKSVSLILDPFITRTLKEMLYRRSKEVTVELAASFDTRFDTLWTNAHDNFKIIGERTADFLNWKYGKFPGKYSAVFCLVDSAKENLLGYIVYSIKDKICHIMDIFFLDLSNNLDALLAEFIVHLRKEKLFAISMSYLGSNAVEEKLKAWGFVKREEGQSIMVFADSSFDHAQYLLNKDHWHLLEGDDI